MLAQFQARYPTASLISELLQIHQGKFVVRVEVQIDGITRATGLAAAETLELAEDGARSRALMVMLPEPSSEMQPGLPTQHLSGMSEVQPGTKASLHLAVADNKRAREFARIPEWNSPSYSASPSAPTPKESALTPADPSKLTVENYGAPAAVTPVAHAEVASKPNSRTL